MAEKRYINPEDGREYRYRRHCAQCFEVFFTNKSTKINCSYDCSEEYHAKYKVRYHRERYVKRVAGREPKFSGRCPECGVEWRSNRSNQRTCGDARCSSKYFSRRENRRRDR